MKTSTPIPPAPVTAKDLQAENEELRARLQEAEETLEAIRTGGVDALVVAEATGQRIYTLAGAERPYRLFVEEMEQGAATLQVDGTLAWCNRRLALMLKTTSEELIGTSLREFVPAQHHGVFDNLLWQGQTRAGRGEAQLRRSDGALIPAFLTFNALPRDCGSAIGVLVTDLTPQRHHEQLTAAHAALRESEERFRTMADNISQLAWTCDRLGNVTWYNQRWLDFTGMPFDDMKGWDWKKVHHPDHIERVVQSVQRSAETGGMWEDTFPLRGKDGSYRWFLSRAVPIRDAQGNLVRWFGTNTDVTEQRLGEQARTQLAAIVEFSEDAIISKDLNGIITSWNRGAEQLFGYAAAEAIGHPIVMLMPPNRQQEETEILERLKLGKNVSHFETVRLRKDGSLIELSLTISPIKDTSGKVIGASKIARDITGRKKVERALRESEERYRTLFNLGPVAVYSIDTSGVIQNFNRHAAELWGREPDLGETDQRFCGSFKMFRPDGSHMPHEQCPMAEVVAGKIPGANDTEVLIERPDGSRITVIVNIRPLRNDRGEVTGAINCFFDITERKQSEDALRHAQAQLADRAGQLEQSVVERTAELTATNKQMEAFVYSIAHDLRAPLRSMQGISRLLVEEAGSTLSETGRNYADRISKSAKFMDALLLDLLAVSRISQDRLEMTAVDLEAVVTEVLSRLEKEIQVKNAEIENPGPWPKVLAHEPMLSQAVFNLVSNSLKFVPPDMPPRIRLFSEVKGRLVRVWVEDSGIGIAPEHQEQIFQLFIRLHGEVYGGTGIGLTIVQKGVERMGGRVGVESTPGQGSRFWFELRKA